MSHSPSQAVLVSGCSSGIGRAAAIALHRKGRPVYATARDVTSLVDLAGLGMATLPLDVTDEESMGAAVAAVTAEHGAVGALVNNAGYGLQGPVETTAIEDVRCQFETNVFGLVRLTQLVLPGMRAQGDGRVVNVGSMGGRFTFPGGGFYHASKHAVEAISDALRLEVAPFGVRVSLVQPGPVTTNFVTAAVDTLPGDGDDAAPSDDDDPYAGFRAALADRYRKAYDGSTLNLEVSADDVAAAIVAAVTSSRPRSRYAVGVMAKTLITTRRLLPDQAWDLVVRSQWPTPSVR